MKTIKFCKNGNTVRIMDYDDEQVMNNLKPAVYTVGVDLGGFFLNYVSDVFEVPDKVYGSTAGRVSKILKTYDSRNRSTGVLLTGDKGSGKTMLSSLLCNEMLERKLPVILIEKPFNGTGFIDFIGNIGECALFFDEFGKVFNKDSKDEQEGESQNELLSVFDGAHTIKRLIILTENEVYKINSYMLNRPGRIFYHFKYEKLEEELVREYCQANDVSEEIIKAILLRIDSSMEFSFDALKAVVEEYKRFGEDIQEIFKNLNIEEGRSFDKRMKIIKILNTETKEEYEPIEDEIDAPNDYGTSFYYKTKTKNNKGEYTTDYLELNIKDLVERTPTRQVYNVENKNRLVILDKISEPIYSANYAHYLAY